jgi:glycine/D-amino acid oxidase-like deaminating enzyme
MGQEDRAMADIDQVAKRWPDASGVYFYRAVLVLRACDDRNRALADVDRALADVDRALADVDRAIAIEPRLSPPYAFRGFLNARAGQLVPACRGLALFVLMAGRSNRVPVRRRHRLAAAPTDDRSFLETQAGQ